MSDIHYAKGDKYAEIYSPQRINGSKVNNPVYLGKVIDKENHIFWTGKGDIIGTQRETAMKSPIGRKKLLANTSY
jgi:hypothetical protein